MSELDELKAEVAELRSRAQMADANLAFMIGILIELSKHNIAVDLHAVIAASASDGWSDILLERMSAGQESIKRARK